MMMMKLIWIRPPLSEAIPHRWLLYCPVQISKPDAITHGPQSNVGLVQRLIRAGERKWADYGQYGPDSFRGQLYRAGQRLIRRLPIQEQMWWRIESAMPCTASDKAQLLIEHGGVTEQEKSILHNAISVWSWHHRRAWLINTAASVPILLLTFLPFVKLLLAWVCFRAVTHHRAFQACKWLSQRFPAAHYELSKEVHQYERDGNSGVFSSADLTDCLGRLDDKIVKKN